MDFHQFLWDYCLILRIKACWNIYQSPFTQAHLFIHIYNFHKQFILWCFLPIKKTDEKLNDLNLQLFISVLVWFYLHVK